MQRKYNIKVPDISGEYEESSFDRSMLAEKKKYVRVMQDGDCIDIHITYTSIDNEYTSHCRGRVLAVNEEMEVIKILADEEKPLWGKQVWYDYKDKNLVSNRKLGIIYLKVNHFAFDDEHINMMLKLINAMVPIIIKKELSFELMPGVEEINTTKYRHTNEVAGYRIDIYTMFDRYSFELYTENLNHIIDIRAGVFYKRDNDGKRNAYFHLQWISEGFFSRMVKRIVDFVDKSDYFSLSYYPDRDNKETFILYND